MKILTEDAFLSCAHRASSRVKNAPRQKWVTINRRPILVKKDPVGWAIAGCPNIVPGQKPCTLTLQNLTGYSAYITVDGQPICLDTITGLTDGLPQVGYLVVTPGQEWVTVTE